MPTKLFVGSLSFDTTDESLREAFAAHGSVVSAVVIRDRDSNRSRGFGFVEYENADEAKTAISELDGKEVDARVVHVSLAQERTERPRSSEQNRDHREQNQQNRW
jgi:RNA recognition motif-containing protein